MSPSGTAQLLHVGLDLSYTGTGMVVMREDLSVIHHIRVSTDVGVHDYQRIGMIWGAVAEDLVRSSPCTISIENYAHGGPQLAKAVRLGEIFRREVYLLGLVWNDVAPSSLKKFATGNGRASKDDMVNSARDLWPMCPNNDEADAFHLARWGLSVHLQSGTVGEHHPKE